MDKTSYTLLRNAVDTLICAKQQLETETYDSNAVKTRIANAIAYVNQCLCIESTHDILDAMKTHCANHGASYRVFQHVTDVDTLTDAEKSQLEKIMEGVFRLGSTDMYVMPLRTDEHPHQSEEDRG